MARSGQGAFKPAFPLLPDCLVHSKKSRSDLQPSSKRSPPRSTQRPRPLGNRRRRTRSSSSVIKCFISSPFIWRITDLLFRANTYILVLFILINLVLVTACCHLGSPQFSCGCVPR